MKNLVIGFYGGFLECKVDEAECVKFVSFYSKSNNGKFHILHDGNIVIIDISKVIYVEVKEVK
jgi:hypothetical protein